MKKLCTFILTCTVLFGAASCQNQDRDTAREEASEAAAESRETSTNVGQQTEDAAEAVGNKTAELGAKGAAAITDKVYKGKVGPDGQTIYIEDDGQYYWIDGKGKKIYVTEVELKDK